MIPMTACLAVAYEMTPGMPRREFKEPIRTIEPLPRLRDACRDVPENVVGSCCDMAPMTARTKRTAPVMLVSFILANTSRSTAGVKEV